MSAPPYAVHREAWEVFSGLQGLVMCLFKGFTCPHRCSLMLNPHTAHLSTSCAKCFCGPGSCTFWYTSSRKPFLNSLTPSNTFLPSQRCMTATVLTLFLNYSSYHHFKMCMSGGLNMLVNHLRQGHRVTQCGPLRPQLDNRMQVQRWSWAYLIF